MARDIEEIRSDIRGTRERLRDTSEALGWKADIPSRARDMLRETAGVVRERMASSERRAEPRYEADSGPGIGERAGHAKEAVGERAGQAKDTVSEKAGAAKDAVVGGASTVSDTVGSAAHAVADKLGSAKEAVAGGAESAKGSLGSAREGVAHRREDIGQGVRKAAGTARANPVGLTLGALAIGVAAGVMLPRTRTEDEAIGPMAEDMRRRGVEAGREALERGREAAEQATDQVREAAVSGTR
jgi:hypothetical protein